MAGEHEAAADDGMASITLRVLKAVAPGVRQILEGLVFPLTPNPDDVLVCVVGRVSEGRSSPICTVVRSDGQPCSGGQSISLAMIGLGCVVGVAHHAVNRVAVAIAESHGPEAAGAATNAFRFAVGESMRQAVYGGPDMAELILNTPNEMVDRLYGDAPPPKNGGPA